MILEILTQVNFYSDSLSTIECGKYRVQIYGSTGSITDSKIYFIPCPLGVNPNNHNNIQCFGDSTGSVGRVLLEVYLLMSMNGLKMVFLL